MNVSLVLVTSGGETKDVAIPRFPAIVGRGEDAAIRVPVGSVSRRHCELTEDDDELVVRDLGSSNGTYVNREKVSQKELVPGDLIAVGPVVLVVRIDGHPKSVDPVLSYAQGAVATGGPSAGAPAAPTAPTISSASGPAAGGAKAPSRPRTPEEEEEARFQRLMRGNPDDSDEFEIDLSDKPKRR